MKKTKAAPAPAAGRVARSARTTGKSQIIDTSSDKRWSGRAERIFLEELAATANVRAAAAAAGFSTTAIYRRRMRWPGFAEDWAQALDQGYARVEATLLEMASDTAALRGAAPIDGGKEAAAPPMSVTEMMNLLRLHRASVRGGAPQRYGAAQAGPIDMEEVRASILRKIEAIERHEARKAAAAEAAAAAAAAEVEAAAEAGAEVAAVDATDGAGSGGAAVAAADAAAGREGEAGDEGA